MGSSGDRVSKPAAVPRKSAAPVRTENGETMPVWQPRARNLVAQDGETVPAAGRW
jgi:hypothetical protein